MIDEGRPLFVQIAEMIENSIIDGTYADEAQVPSTNELAAFHRINPATAGKGLAKLVADGILYKRRGIGMFVTNGASDALRFRRREDFAKQYIEPLITEANKLGMTVDELKTMLDTWEERS
ncbi:MULTISPECIES: GntR family transcriptional regulator [Nocardiaceae]|uniref:GntR family transcriptional regulator n=1 Tax=Nocardiaceae TaxID=85025 RepID=UPI001E482965|nr:MULTISPECIES: GntR family transcriptional regulator [Rhodococcus]MCC8926349.1 GntR family transcriptional regulator [Rhodococcus sp. I2R]MCZ4274398.1 GntR family transcriptional regulator [Rhodococcus yunnanensis]